jgi:hypothetical protein
MARGGYTPAASRAEVTIEATRRANTYTRLLRSELPPFSLETIGANAKAQEVNLEIVLKVNLSLGNEEDFYAMLGVDI